MYILINFVFTLKQPLHIQTLTHTYVCTYIVARDFVVVGQLAARF